MSILADRSEKHRIILNKVFIILLFLITSLMSMAQETISVSGMIKNAETLEPIEYATIGLLGKAQGTISNELGEFSFIINQPEEKDEVVFSAIGYKSQSIPILAFNLDSTEMEVLLEPAIYSMDEIVVTGINPLDIIEKALTGIYKNYPTQPHLLKGFYREYMEEDGQYTRLVEAAVDIIEDGYRVKGKNVHSREKVLVKEIRNADDYRTFSAYNYDGLSFMLNENIAGYNPGGILNTYPTSDWTFDFQEKTLVDGIETYVISFTPKSDKYARPSGVAYLTTDDYSIVKMDWTINNALDGWLKKYYADTVYIEHTNWEAEFSYRRYKKKMYLNYIKHKRSYDIIDSQTDSTRSSVDVFSELLINDIRSTTSRFFTETKTVKDYNLAYFSDYSYNKAFWDSYNLPMATRKMRECYNALTQFRELDRILTYDPAIFLEYDELGVGDTSLRLEKYELWFDLDEDIIEGEPDFILGEDLNKDTEGELSEPIIKDSLEEIKDGLQEKIKDEAIEDEEEPVENPSEEDDLE